MTREEAHTFLLQLNTDKQLNPSEHEALRVAIKALEQEPCEDCVSVLNRVMEYTYGMLTAEKAGLQHLIKSMLDDLPSVKTKEPKTGHWIEEVGNHFVNYECSVCHNRIIYHYDYCPNCGAKMESEG